MIMLKRFFCNPVMTLRTGLVFLVLANFATYYLHPSQHLSDAVVGGIDGFCYGIAIGLLILSIRQRRRPTCIPA
jgi:peptidoglycan/LPS O-acetylase OafA/YrhL